MDFLKTAWDKVILVGAAVGGLFTGLLGGSDIPVWVLIGIMAIDYGSGCIVAAMGHSPKSETGGLNGNIGWKGLGKKILTLAIVIVAALIDKVLGDGSAIRTAACWFYIANEALSILENSALAGVEWPEPLMNALEQMKGKGKETE